MVIVVRAAGGNVIGQKKFFWGRFFEGRVFGRRFFWGRVFRVVEWGKFGTVGCRIVTGIKIWVEMGA